MEFLDIIYTASVCTASASGFALAMLIGFAVSAWQDHRHGGAK